MVMRWDGTLSCWAKVVRFSPSCRPQLFDLGDHVVNEHSLVAFLVDLDADGLRGTSRLVPALALSHALLRERPDCDQTIELPVAVSVPPRPSNSSKEHHLA